MADSASSDKQLTERVVLRFVEEDYHDDVGEYWEYVGRAATTTKEGAIRTVAEGKPGKYRSVPLRSWQGGTEIVLPEKPKPESKPFE